VTTTALPLAVGHPFYARLTELLREQGFDDFSEAQCARFYADTMAGRVCGRADHDHALNGALPGWRRTRKRPAPGSVNTAAFMAT